MRNVERRLTLLRLETRLQPVPTPQPRTPTIAQLTLERLTDAEMEALEAAVLADQAGQPLTLAHQAIVAHYTRVYAEVEAQTKTEGAKP
jgi:hypothetical protein